jgi:hypothetical protein
MVDQQEKLWNGLLEKHQTDEKQMNNDHVEQQCLTFDVLLVEAQKERKKQVEARQNRYVSELKQNRRHELIDTFFCTEKLNS